MCKKKTNKAKIINAKAKSANGEVIEVIHTVVPHLGALARKNLEKMVASDPVHQRLENLL